MSYRSDAGEMCISFGNIIFQSVLSHLYYYHISSDIDIGAKFRTLQRNIRIKKSTRILSDMISNRQCLNFTLSVTSQICEYIFGFRGWFSDNKHGGLVKAVLMWRGYCNIRNRYWTNISAKLWFQMSSGHTGVK